MSTTAVTRASSPIITSGIPSRSTPAATTAATGNAAIATSYSANPVASSTSSVGIAGAIGGNSSAGVGVTGTGANLNIAGVKVTSAQSGIAAAQRIDSQITGAPQSASYAGDVKSAIGALTAFAQSKMDAVQANIKALMSSEGGEMNAAKLQVYSQELANYETMMQMAAKLQEKEERALAIWVR